MQVISGNQCHRAYSVFRLVNTCRDCSLCDVTATVRIARSAYAAKSHPLTRVLFSVTFSDIRSWLAQMTLHCVFSIEVIPYSIIWTESRSS